MDALNVDDEATMAIILLLLRRRRPRPRPIWSRDHFLLRTERGEYHRTFLYLKDNRDDELFWNYTRMSYTTFDALKNMIANELEPTQNNFRRAIEAEQKLVLTLRHLATGGSFTSMSAPFHMHRTTIGKHVKKTFKILWKILQPIELKKTNTEEEWLTISRRFGDLWDYPFAVGAIDGKHIALVNPDNAGSQYYNYKGFPSIVLMAICDADSNFIIIDCGQYGRISDAGVFNASKMSEQLHEGKLNIPNQEFRVESSNNPIPFVVVGDEAFPLKKNIMKPFAKNTLNDERRIYNYRHSRARRTSECTFGIMAAKFEVFQRPIRLEPDDAIDLTQAAVVLHNFIRRRDGVMVDRTSEVKYTLAPGEILPEGPGLLRLAHNARGRVPNEAASVRTNICNYFNDPEGRVSWQERHVFRNVLPAIEEMMNYQHD